MQARKIQQARFAQLPGIYTNAMMSSNMVRSFCAVDTQAMALLKAAMEKLDLSARAFDRILKVARSIADLAAAEQIAPEHVAEAIQYRSLDRESWGG